MERHWFVVEADALMHAGFGDPLVHVVPTLPKAKLLKARIDRYRHRLRTFLLAGKDKCDEKSTLGRFWQQNAMSLNQFMDTITEALFAPAHGTGATFGHFLMHLAQFPLEQHRLRSILMDVKQTEEDKVIALDSFVKESMRLRPIFHTNLPHRCTQDTILNFNSKQIKLEKGSMCAIDVHSFNNNPNVFGANVNQFDLCRFILNQSQKKVPDPHYFGVGFRRCLGVTWVTYFSRLFLRELVMNYEVCLSEEPIITHTSSFTSHNSGSVVLYPLLI